MSPKSKNDGPKQRRHMSSRRFVGWLLGVLLLLLAFNWIARSASFDAATTTWGTLGFFLVIIAALMGYHRIADKFQGQAGPTGASFDWKARKKSPPASTDLDDEKTFTDAEGKRAQASAADSEPSTGEISAPPSSEDPS